MFYIERRGYQKLFIVKRYELEISPQLMSAAVV